MALPASPRVKFAAVDVVYYGSTITSAAKTHNIHSRNLQRYLRSIGVPPLLRGRPKNGSKTINQRIIKCGGD